VPGSLLPLVGADPNRIRAVTLVGRYALGVTWEDGHGSIYPFPVLRAACACEQCPAAPAPWPVEIHREAAALRVRWQDGHVSDLPHRMLRARCPCAQCTKTPARAGS
jgi:DUF971 family protein